MSSLYTHIVKIRSNMHVTVDQYTSWTFKFSPRIPAYPLLHWYKTPYIAIVKVRNTSTYAFAQQPLPMVIVFCHGFLTETSIFPRVVRTISESCSLFFPRVENALFESWHHVFFLRSQCLHYRSYLESSVTDEFTYTLLMGLSKQQISGQQYNLHQRIEI